MKVVCERCGRSGSANYFALNTVKYLKNKWEFALCNGCYNALLNAFLESGFTDPQGGIQGQMDMDAVDPETGEIDTSSVTADAVPPSPSGKAYAEA